MMHGKPNLKVPFVYSCPILMKLEFSGQIWGKLSNIKFNENSSSGSRVVPCGQTDRRADMTKLKAAFRNYANAREKGRQSLWSGL
jgi:hypothetical protein